MKKHLHFLLITVFSLLAFSNLQAQDFVYTPKNPAFGGDTFNYNWLLSSAQSQNLLEEDETGSGLSALESFTQSLERQILSNLSRQIAGSQFGESTLDDGTYQVGSFGLDVISTLDGLSITITDPTTGESTQIIVPYY
ncbi:MAG: curli production assembly/transport component CsgF [Saprospiraceae bacterium]